MRRLSDHLADACAVHRENGERGAVAVLTALCLVVLLGFAAIAIDVGRMYEERAQLQSGADAAALAIAQQCGAGGVCTPEGATSMAQQYAASNARDGVAHADVPAIVSNTVKVTTRTKEASGAGTLALSFAPVLGIADPKVAATATATWITPKKGPAVLPIVFSHCDFHLGSGVQLLEMHSGKNNETSYAGGCKYMGNSSSGTNLPGGFGIIQHPSGKCTTTVDTGQKASSDTGNSLPGVCEAVIKEHIGKTVLLPVYRDLGGSGNNAWYEIDGWVAFKLLGYRFPGLEKDNESYTGATCLSPCTGIIGQFERFATLDQAFTGGGPNYGASVVGLTG
ncbi:pilus assembly protein TadG-related protein [Kocuria rosea]|uniref:pilus assembly protein TadG-related protein n=1 Tax=Kocuria rosea TaxID=1275 RepID=UPI00301737DD